VNQRVALMAIILSLGHSFVFGQQTASISPRVITLRSAMQQIPASDKESNR
jgi:hypothetical protein